jgi:hypothetical protein
VPTILKSKSYKKVMMRRTSGDERVEKVKIECSIPAIARRPAVLL